MKVNFQLQHNVVQNEDSPLPNTEGEGENWPELALALFMFILLMVVAVHIAKHGKPRRQSYYASGSSSLAPPPRHKHHHHFNNHPRPEQEPEIPQSPPQRTRLKPEPDSETAKSPPQRTPQPYHHGRPQQRVSSSFCSCCKSQCYKTNRRHSDAQRRSLTPAGTDEQLYPPDKLHSASFIQKLLGTDNVVRDDKGYELEVVDTQGYPLQLHMKRVIGKGNFGLVLMADVYNSDWSKILLRGAVKMPRDRSNDENLKNAFRERACREDLVNELEVRRRIPAHPNIVSAYGWRLRSDYPLIILELLAAGSLQQYLISQRPSRRKSTKEGLGGGSLTPQRLLNFATDIGKGVEFLAKHYIVHRDLATRNVLMSKLRCKISDLGLSKFLKTEDGVYTKEKGIFPYRWMAPESISRGEWTLKTDVWSYGVILWEIVTYARKPYPGKETPEVKKTITDGTKLEKPVHCSEDIYHQMLRCWETDPADRPHIRDIVRWFEEEQEHDLATQHLDISLYESNKFKSELDLVHSGDLETERI